MMGTIGVFEPLPDKTLRMVDEIKTGYSLDNISVDRDGDLFVALYPIGVEIFNAYKNPWGTRAPAAAMRISKTEKGYVMKKIIEDGPGEVLPAATTVVHDAATGRLFFSSELHASYCILYVLTRQV